jgi:hypothetical protein
MILFKINALNCDVSKILCEKDPLNACNPNNENMDKTINIRIRTSENIISDFKIAPTIVFKPK